jgi:hypothetical protein
MSTITEDVSAAGDGFHTNTSKPTESPLKKAILTGRKLPAPNLCADGTISPPKPSESKIISISTTKRTPSPSVAS